MTFELEQETDGRWLCDYPALAGVMAYGATPQEAFAACWALMVKVLAEAKP